MDIVSTTSIPDLSASITETTSSQFYAIDYVVFCGLLSLSMGIGVYFGYFSKSEHTTEEYLLGGRKMKTVPIAISLIASQLSALTIIGVPAEAYGYGSTYMMAILPMLILVAIFLNYGVLPVFYNNNIDSCYAYLELRFNRSVQHLIIGLFFIAVLLSLPVFSFIPALSFSQVSGLNIHLINAVVGTICVLYTMMGGIKAVVWTDVLQATVMMVSIVLVFAYAVFRVGGFDIVIDRAIAGARLNPVWVLDLTTRQSMWSVTIGTLPMWATHLGMNQSCVQRILALPTINHARRALVLVCFGVTALIMTNSFIGIIIYAYYYNCDPIRSGKISQLDKLVPYFVNDLVGNVGGMPGLFIACVFSASLSTVSAYLNSLAGLIYKDYICKVPGFKHSESNANVIMKSTIVVIGVYTLVMGLLLENSPSMFQVLYTLAGITQGVVFGVFTLGMFYPKANCRATLLASFITISFMVLVFVVGQVHRNAHALSYELLPTSTDGCYSKNITLAQDEPSSTIKTFVQPNEAEKSIYNVSFTWYGMIGSIVFWLIATVLSRVVGPQDVDTKVEPRLISPLAQFMLPKTNRHIEMQVLDKNIDRLQANIKKTEEETTYVIR